MLQIVIFTGGEANMSLLQKHLKSSVSPKFLGRTLNHNTMMWEFGDGSGVPIPEEVRQDVFCSLENGEGGTLEALGRIFKYKDEHND